MSSHTFMDLFILVKTITISHYIFQGKKSLDEVGLSFFFSLWVSQDFWVAVSIVC